LLNDVAAQEGDIEIS